MRIAQFKNDFYSLLSYYDQANRLILKLKEYGELFLFGGAVREYLDNKYSSLPRDFDIVIDKKYEDIDLDYVLECFEYKKNRFGGYKIKLDNLEFDIWEIENTWAFKENKIICSKKEYPKKLQETVFLNIDSIVYNLSKDEMYSEKYYYAMENKVLDIVLHENPHKDLNMLRSIVFKRKYEMSFSKSLQKLLVESIKENEEYSKILYDLQFSHYNYEKISKKVLDCELKELFNSQNAI